MITITFQDDRTSIQVNAQTIREAVEHLVLKGVNLTTANLRGANLADANLPRADLRGTDLAYANLWGANLAGANLTDANLAGAKLTATNLADTTLTDATMAGSTLRYADLTGAKLWGVTLWYADLTGAKLSGAIGLQPPVKLPDGSFHAYKKVRMSDGRSAVLALRIPEDAARVAPYTGTKCRASKVVVEAANMPSPSGSYTSLRDATFTYTLGAVVQANAFNDDPRFVCAPGIHFFLTEAEALAFVLS